MNEKFYSLPKEKQQAIINAGYRIFSQNSYKKSPMQKVADAAGISKSFLFHYFHNKKDFYMFLLKAKIHIMKKYPFMGSFVIRAFYETDPLIQSEIEKSYAELISLKAVPACSNLGSKQFIEGAEPERILREMYLVSEGYLWELQKKRESDIEKNIEKIEADFQEMIAFWKKIYLRKKG